MQKIEIWESLNRTQKQIVILLCKGYNNQEIATQLYYSVQNIEKNLTAIYKQHQLRSRTDLGVRIAIELCQRNELKIIMESPTN